MNKPTLDATDRPLSVGDLVCYTTNSRGAGLEFGHIEKIIEKPVTRYRFNRVTGNQEPYTDFDHKIVVMRTDAKGAPLYERDYDYASSQWITTSQQQRSGRIDYSANKFLLL